MDDQRRVPLFVSKTDRYSRGAVPAFLFDLMIDFEANLTHHREDLFVLELLLIERLGIGRIEINTQRDTKGYAVLRHHQIFRLVDGMMRYQFFDTADDNLTNIFRIEIDLLAQFLQRFNRRVRVNVASTTLDTDIESFEGLSQAMGEIGKLRRIGECPAKAKLPFENAFRSGEASARQQSRGHASLRGFTEVEPLDHGSLLAAGKFDQPTRV